MQSPLGTLIAELVQCARGELHTLLQDLLDGHCSLHGWHASHEPGMQATFPTGAHHVTHEAELHLEPGVQAQQVGLLGQQQGLHKLSM